MGMPKIPPGASSQKWYEMGRSRQGVPVLRGWREPRGSVFHLDGRGLPPQMNTQEMPPCYPSQSPRSRAPHVLQGSACGALLESRAPPTAKTESNFSTSGLPHFLQVGFAAAELMMDSNRAPQARHSYSKIGISRLPMRVYRKPGMAFKGRPCEEKETASGWPPQPHFFWRFLRWRGGK
jgi:hypothetical protein